MQRAVILVFLAIGLIAAGFLGWRYFGNAADAVWADPNDTALVARGATVYEEQCAACHGARLEGQPNWRKRLPNGRLPAPPHDRTGHTWHHADQQLFDITKNGSVAYGPPGYKTDMRAFKDALSDRDIWAVLAYIKSEWPDSIRNRQSGIDARSKKSQSQ
jgi:mono/diheme cytochrome c family protein